MLCVFFFQAEDGIRDLVRSRGLGDVYKRQEWEYLTTIFLKLHSYPECHQTHKRQWFHPYLILVCLLYTSDAADERSSVDLGGRRIIKKKKR